MHKFSQGYGVFHFATCCWNFKDEVGKEVLERSLMHRE